MLGPLADNGGPTETHALLAGSPAIDAGLNAPCPGTDQRGVARPQDGDEDGDAVCDSGAYELGGEEPTPTPTTPPGDGGGNPNVEVAVSDDSPEVGDTVDLTVTVIDDAGNPVSGVECAFSITSQPGSDASLGADSGTTDENGIAAVSLDVGSTPGVIEVTADCGAFGSEVLEITVGAAGLPPTGMSGSGTSRAWTWTVGAALVALAALAGGARLARARSRD
jgi:hypothetical protein